MADKNSSRSTLMTMQEWIDYELDPNDKEVVIGSTNNPIVGPKTKNLIEAPEKSFKTTFLHRLMAGASCGQTVFPDLPVPAPRRILYLHGELSNRDIKSRIEQGCMDLKGPFDNLIEGRVFDAHLVTLEGKKVLQDLIETHTPTDVVLDPWQCFMSGVDENSNTVVSAACRFCDELINDYDLTLWIAIHLGKNPKKGPRGHSYVGGWRDNSFRLSRVKSSVTVNADLRWAEPLKAFKLKFEGGTLWPDGYATYTGNSERIRDFLASEGGIVPFDELAEYLGKSDDAVRKAIERAAEHYPIKRKGELVVLEMEPVSSIQ